MQKRRRIKQTETLRERLAHRAAILKQKANALPPGGEREILLNKIQQLDFAIDLDDTLRPPPVHGQ